MDQAKKNELKNIFGHMLYGVWDSFGHKKHNTIDVIDAFKKAMSDQAIDVTITIHSDDNDYED